MFWHVFLIRSNPQIWCSEHSSHQIYCFFNQHKMILMCKCAFLSKPRTFWLTAIHKWCCVFRSERRVVLFSHLSSGALSWQTGQWETSAEHINHRAELQLTAGGPVTADLTFKCVLISHFVCDFFLVFAGNPSFGNINPCVSFLFCFLLFADCDI